MAKTNILTIFSLCFLAVLFNEEIIFFSHNTSISTSAAAKIFSYTNMIFIFEIMKKHSKTDGSMLQANYYL